MSAEKKPRPYQLKAISEFCDWIDNGPNQDLATMILPTGGGKTATAVWSIKEKQNLKVLWVAHREELIDQAYQEFRNEFPDKNIQIEMAAQRAGTDADIIVGSVQTLHRCRKNIQGFEPNLVVIDEWHHYDEKNKSYHGIRERYSGAKLLGLTATPYRMVGNDLPLGRVLIQMDIGTAVANGYLVPPKPEALKTKVSLANVKTRAGDFALDELSKAVNVDDRNQLIAKRIIQTVKEEKRQGILFGVDVAHAKAMTQLLKNEVRTAEIYGETDKEERRELMKKMRNGEIDVFVNNLCGTEGFNIPHFNFVCVARPTKSLGLFVQMIGRGLRLFTNKTDCLIIDVFDKVKTTQSRITYSDVAAAGDIDGDVRRTDAILKESIADKLVNFPVVMALSKGQRWIVDMDRWFAPAWVLAENQWVITWTKRDELKESKEFTYASFKYTPNKHTIESSKIQVKHHTYGEGVVCGIDQFNFSTLIVDFNNEKIKCDILDLQKREPKFDKIPLKNPIKRAFYICLKDESYGRLISMQQDKSSFTVLDDIKGDATTLNEMIKIAANQDDMVQVVRADAKWRSRPISDKQKKLVEQYVGWGKLTDDVDISVMTSGDASVIIDQVSWHDSINGLLGTKNRDNLIGYKTAYH